MTERSPLCRKLLLGTGWLLLGGSLLGTLPTNIHISPDRAPAGPFSFTVPGAVSSGLEPYPLALHWQREMPRESLHAFSQSQGAVPLNIDGRLYLGSAFARGVLVVDARDGALLSRILTRGVIEYALTRDSKSGDLIVGDDAGFVYRFTLEGGKVWEHESSGPIVSSTSVADGSVFYHAIDGSLVSLDLETGEPAWSFRRKPRIGSGLEIFGYSGVVMAEGLVISGFSDGSVVAIRKDDGTLVWERQLVHDGMWTDVDGDPLLLPDDRLVIVGYQGPAVCLKASTGEELWRSSKVAGNGRPTFHDGKLYLPNLNGGVTALNADSGEFIWEWQAPKGATPLTPVLFRDALIVTTSDGLLFVLNRLDGGELWTFRPERKLLGFSAPPLVDEELGCVYLVSDGGVAYALGAPDYSAVIPTTRRKQWQLPWE